MPRSAWALFGLAVAFGCGHGARETAPPPVPARAATAGDRLLGYLPAGADAVVEIDLARLRTNPAVGPLLAALIPEQPAAPGDWSLLGVGAGLLGTTDTLVMGVYRPGRPEARSVVIACGDGLAERAGGGRPIDRDTVAIGPPELLDQLIEGGADFAASEPVLARLRALAMPKEASGAALRVAARLDFDARVELASRFELDAVPATLSVWGDVADDLALVAVLGGADDAEAAELARAARRGKQRLARAALVRRLSLSPLADDIEVGVAGSSARILFVIQPRRLAKIVAFLVRRLGE